ncbi:MAG: guanylate kinase [Gammaproteobacteria bacterium]|jgi:guanylate kinase
MDKIPGNLIVLSAPSGAGKTSLVHAVIDRLERVSSSVSHTTRARRPNEVDGEDYFFVSTSEFEHMIARGDFIEHAEVFGNLYGTSQSEIQKMLDNGIDLLLEIDWQGARSIRQSHPRARSIFILPPSNAALRKRLLGRAGDDPDVIENRMQAAASEMSHYDEYEFLLINDDFERTLGEFCLIIQACRLSTDSQRARFTSTLDELMASAVTI